MTGSKASASINVWTSTLGLNLVGGFNFNHQVYREETLSKLFIDDMVKVYDEKGTTVLVAKALAAFGSLKLMAENVKANEESKDGGEASAAKATAVSTPPHPSSPVNMNQNIEDFTAFGLDALFDESNNVEAIVKESDDSESSDDDDEVGNFANFQAAWFQAKERPIVTMKDLKSMTESSSKAK